MNALPFEKQVRVVSALVEGNSIRATERMTEVHRDTIMRLGVRIGEACTRLHDRIFRSLNVGVLEVDEAWSFIFKKQKRLEPDDPIDFGDAYSFIAIDANRKAVVSYAVGKRDGTTTNAFITDLRARVLNRPQITSDGFKPYVTAIEAAFGADVDYAMLVKMYAGDEHAIDAAHRYSPGEIRGTEVVIVQGSPKESRISTSYAERNNLTLRMQMRRYTRLTNGFSKKLQNHRAALALHVAWYNLCRVHETLRVTPAMALGVTDHVWSIAELIGAALATPAAPEPKPAPSGDDEGGMSAAQASRPIGRRSAWDAVREAAREVRKPRLTLIRGGLS